jgi:phage shock protein PspC (stress-responsive transcriptional regulator)
MSTPTPGDPLEPDPVTPGDPLGARPSDSVTPGDPLSARPSDAVTSGDQPGARPSDPVRTPPPEPEPEPATGTTGVFASQKETGPRRLTRSRSERVFGGVAGGLGRYFDVDPVVFRIGFAAATLAGGLGLFVYLAALLFVPDEGSDKSPADRSKLLTITGAVVLGIAALAAIDNGPGFFFGPLVPLAIAGGVGYAIYRAVGDGGTTGPATVGRMARWVAVGAGAILAFFALAFGSAWAAAEGSGAIVAALVIAIGVFIILSATRGRSARWLALPALALAIPLGVVSAADISLDGGIGERTYSPATVADLREDGYRLGAGELVVDLRGVDLPAGQETVLDVELGMGSAEVLVDDDVCVVTDTRVGGGYVNVLGRDSGGVDLDFRVRADAGSAPRLLVRGDIGLGALEVLEAPYGRSDGPRIFDEDEGGFLDTPARNGACTDVQIASAG